MSSTFVRLASYSQRHHWTALLSWVVVLVAVTVGSIALGNDYRDDHTLPGSESQKVSDAFAAQESAAKDSVQIVLHADAGLDSGAVKSRVETMRADVDDLGFVSSVGDPYQSPGALSDDRATAFVDVGLDSDSADTDPADVRQLVATAQQAEGDGLRIELGGDSVRAATEAGGGAEGIGMIAALLILVPLFGSVLAGSLPIVTAIFAVGSAAGVIAFASHVATVPSYAVPMMMLVGLGAGIDYALLIFSRYRSEIVGGADRDTATRKALDTAGRSVLFAGLTVLIALLGLLVLGLGSLQGLALSVALTVLMTMVASITLLPALLTIFGRRLERSIVKHTAKSTRQYGDRWRRLADVVQRRPVPALVVSMTALVLLMLPALDMRLGFADAGTDAPATTSRQAYDLLADGFGDGANGPLIVLTEGDPAAAEKAADAVRGTDGVREVVGPMPLAGGNGSNLMVFPDSAPSSEATTDLVESLRSEVLPDVAAETGATYLVGGATPAAIDFASAVADRLPYFIGAVVLLSALLLMAVFRSVLIPLKAAVLNLLSIGAAMGVMTFVFGEGNLGAQAGPIEAFLPVIIFAVVFGLSMDYEVFLVSRMHEEWRRTGDPTHAVREGLAMTGGVITAAAGIMIVVFGAFVASPDRMLQQMGLGLAVAVFLDAVVIRCLIVPAVMRLLGERAWWLPRWLDRALPTIALEGEDADRRAPEPVGAAR